MTTQSYSIRGMTCSSCAASIEQGLTNLPGVERVQVDFASATLTLEGAAEAPAVQRRIKALGFTAQPALPGDSRRELAAGPGGVRGFWAYLIERPETRLALLGGALVALALAGEYLGLPGGFVEVLFLLAMIITAAPIARSGLNTLWINRTFNINLLMTIAAVGAVAIGETLEGASVIFLFALGEALEGYTASRARASLRSLIELAPAQAIRVRGGQEATVPVEEIGLGDLLLIKPGERIPLDGIVISGQSSVNQAPITGESMPVEKIAGERVFAGTVNGSGLLRVEVTELSADSTLSRIIYMVEQAQSVRAPSQRIIDQFARFYTPAVVVVALLVATLPPLLFQAPLFDLADGSRGWLYRALALLVIACPCALVISAPVTIISGITAAARRGVLIKGGAHMETLGRIKVIAFDKTGTLTRGQPTVTASRSADCQTGIDCAQCEDILALASAVERGSTHPLARAIVGAAEDRRLGAAYQSAEAVVALSGQGVQGRVNGQLITVGSHTLFDAEHPHSVDLCGLIDRSEAAGQTTMLLCDGERVRGFIAVADTVRAESRAAVSELSLLGATTAMLTGDNAVVASAVGREVGIDEVRAGLLPGDKVAAVKDLEQRFGPVAMIGDGINDTPALAAAALGVAMGGAGSSQAIETADVVLMSDGLHQLPFALRLGREVRHLIRQNVALSLGVKLVFMGLAISGGASLWLAILADTGMALLVTLNGMRPLRHGPLD